MDVKVSKVGGRVLSRIFCNYFYSMTRHEWLIETGDESSQMNHHWPCNENDNWDQSPKNEDFGLVTNQTLHLMPGKVSIFDKYRA